MNILTKLQNIDRRIVYLLLAAVITIPLLVRPARHPRFIFNEVTKAYNVIDSVSGDNIVLISSMFGPGTIAENGPQARVLMRHMFQQGIKFAIISWDQAGNEITYQIGKELEQELGKEYGVDWVHLGFRVFYPQAVVRGMALDFQSVIEYDRFRTPIKKIPVVANVKSHEQIGAVVEITPSGTVEYIISYFTGPYNKPLVFCPTAVMAAEAYPFLDSGQISGMLNGVIGAAQYETLIGMGNERTDAAATSWALSAAHIFIIILIILGNLAYFASKRAGRVNGGRARD